MNGDATNTDGYRRSLRRYLICLWLFSGVMAHAALAGESGDRAERPKEAWPRQQTVFQTDAAGEVNPEGLLLLFGVYHRRTAAMDESLGVPLGQLLNDRMASAHHAHLAGLGKARASVAILRGDFRERHRQVQFRDRRGCRLDSRRVRARQHA